MTLEPQREQVAKLIMRKTNATAEHSLLAADSVLEYLSAQIDKTIKHFRDGLIRTPSDSPQYIANSNRAFGADCARDAINMVMEYGKHSTLDKVEFPSTFSKLEELAVRLCAYDSAIDPEAVLEHWGDGGWKEDEWRIKAREHQMAYEVLSK